MGHPPWTQQAAAVGCATIGLTSLSPSGIALWQRSTAAAGNNIDSTSSRLQLALAASSPTGLSLCQGLSSSTELWRQASTTAGGCSSGGFGWLLL